MAKITIAELLSKKEQLKNKKPKTQTLYVESLGGEIVIQEPDESIAIEALQMTQDAGKEDLADPYLVYNCVIEPNLKDPSLQTEFGCKEPTDIPKIIFKSGELATIGGFALKLAGYGNGVRAVDEKLKN